MQSQRTATMDVSQISMHDTHAITRQPQFLITSGNKTNSLKSMTLQRSRQLDHADARLRRRMREYSTQFGWTTLSVCLMFELLGKKSDKYLIGEFLAYLGSPNSNRIARIIMYTLRRTSLTAYARFTQKLSQWLEANAVQTIKFIEKWADLISNPYDKDGILTDCWKRRIRYFTSHQHKLELLAESSPLEVWSIFLDPSWWLRLRTSYYGMTLRPIVNSPYILHSVRTQLRLRYDASGYGRARKSSRLRKSIRAEVETAVPQTWNVRAVYGHR